MAVTMSVYSRPGIQMAKVAVCKVFNVTAEDIVSKSRKHPLPHARFVAWYFERQSGRKLRVIANEYNIKSHESILHGIRTVKDLLDVDRGFQANVEAVKQLL